MAPDSNTPVTEAQSSLTQTLVWTGVMIIVVALLAYFAA